MTFMTIPAAKNLILNPSAEVSAATGVTTYGTTVTVTRDLTEAWSGDASFKVVTTGSGTRGVRWLTGTDIKLEFQENVVIGEIRAKAAPGTIVPVTIIATFRDMALLTFEEAIPIPLEYTMTGGWDTLELPPVLFDDHPAPAWELWSAAIVYETTLSQTVWFDGVHISDALIDFYVDGDQGTGYTWDGTAHNSISRRSLAQLLLSPTGEIQASALIEYRVEVRTQNNVFIRDITPYVIEGSVEANVDADSKLACQFRVSQEGLVADWTEWIAPFIKVTFPDGVVKESQCGLFVSTPPSEETTWLGTTYTLEGRDALWLLAMRNPNLGYTIAKNTRYDVALRSILTANGFTRHAIPAISRTLPDVYKPTKENGYAYAMIMNDLTDDVAHYNAWADLDGTITTMPYADFKTSAVNRYWKNGDAVFEPFSTEAITTTLANHIVVRKDDPQEPIEWEEFNDDPDSPMRISKVGRLSREIVDTDIADLATAKLIAKQYMQVWSSYQKNAQMVTFLDPGRGLHEIYSMNFIDEDEQPLRSMTGRYWVKGWKITIGTSVEMVHQMYRVEEYGANAA
jgi:hypothetical protein